MYQFYIIEIQKYPTGEFGHIVHYVWDERNDIARLKGESKYHEVLAAAAISNLPSHAAIMFNTDGFPIMHQCYIHEVEQDNDTDTEQDGSIDDGVEADS